VNGTYHYLDLAPTGRAEAVWNARRGGITRAKSVEPLALSEGRKTRKCGSNCAAKTLDT